MRVVFVIVIEEVVVLVGVEEIIVVVVVVRVQVDELRDSHEVDDVYETVGIFAEPSPVVALGTVGAQVEIEAVVSEPTVLILCKVPAWLVPARSIGFRIT